MTNPLICAVSGEESVNAEMKSIFPSMQGTSATPTSCINEQSHEAVLSRADTAKTTKIESLSYYHKKFQEASQAYW